MIYAQIKTKDGQLGQIVFADKADDLVIEMNCWMKDNNLKAEDVEAATIHDRETKEQLGIARCEADNQWYIGQE